MKRIACILLIIAVVGCIKTELPPPDITRLQARWETDGDSVHLQFYQAYKWQTIAKGTPDGTVFVQGEAGLYRLIVFKDADSIYSKVINVR